MPDDLFERELAGLDALELALPIRRSALRRRWSKSWPPLTAMGIVIFGWELLVWWRWKPEYILPSPFTVAKALKENFALIVSAAQTTLIRGAKGFLFATISGTLVGIAAARFKIVRTAIGSLITGLQTMPSVAWTPLAIVLFKISEGAIFFVVVLGAAPSVANGLLQGIDQVPPILMRAGRALGAKGMNSMRHVVLPAAFPTYVGGLKQGWAFAWRALMGAEIIAKVAGKESLGQQLENNRALSDYPSMYAVMVAVLAIGITIDIVVFAKIERTLRIRYGLVEASAQ